MTPDTIIHLILAAFIAAALLRGGKQGPPGPRGEKGEKGDRGDRGDDAKLPPHLVVGAPKPDTSQHRLFRVMRLVNGDWEPGEWVREGTDDWQRHWDTPGVALQCGNERELGVQ